MTREMGVIHFTPCTATTTLASSRIARYIADKTFALLIDNEDMAATMRNTEFDVLFVVNGPFGFCGFRDEVAQIVGNAKRLIWVQNDYALKVPSQIKQHDFEVWTTVQDVSESALANRYINWNQLTFYPEMWKKLRDKHQYEGLFYYGAFRQGRVKSFNRYLKSKLYPIHISTTATNKFQEAGYAEMNIKYFGPFKSPAQMGLFKSTVYVEDDHSHNQFHSMANRFYECLSAGIAIAVDRSTMWTFKKSGLKIDTRWIVDSSLTMKEFLELCKREDVAFAQRKLWGINHRRKLDARLLELAEENDWT